ncbi:hypothetical protein N0V90_009827 [Kalmusia sp. IMI 367209]|nr:hypothetical protein N0V90_009827 [Kalmusia sp. IMI 367209]
MPENWRDERLYSTRAGMYCFDCAHLTEEHKDSILKNATSREHFHNVEKIMSEPYWGLCLCELRFISGQKCLKHLMKEDDGKTAPTGKDHWAWFIDICPRGFVCPFAKKRGEDNGGDPQKEACDILLGKPTNEWALAQHAEDPKGTVAGRVSTDIFLSSECPRCLGFKVDPETNQILNPQHGKWMLRPDPKNPWLYESPIDYDPAMHEDLHPADQPPAWDKWLAVQPVQFRPVEGTERWHHPALKPYWLYHVCTLLHLYISPEDIWIPDHPFNMNWHDFLVKQNLQEEARLEQQREVSAIAMTETVLNMKRKELVEQLVAKDTRQWH